jgi:hypothetical protein
MPLTLLCSCTGHAGRHACSLSGCQAVEAGHHAARCQITTEVNITVAMLINLIMMITKL